MAASRPPLLGRHICGDTKSDRFPCTTLPRAPPRRIIIMPLAAHASCRFINSEFALVCNLLYLTLRTLGRTLLQRPVWDDPCVGSHRESSEKIFDSHLVVFRCVRRVGSSSSPNSFRFRCLYVVSSFLCLWSAFLCLYVVCV